MNINEAKTKLKEKGYSIRTIYDPNKDTVEIHILKNNSVIDQFRAFESNLEEHFISIENSLK